MAYGLIQVDKVENSDGKSLNVGPSARVFDTVTDLQASTTLSSGDIVIVKERANAEYEIQPTGYTTLDGDVALTSGQVADLQLKAVNDVRWWGADPDNDDGNHTEITSAISRLSTRVVGETGSFEGVSRIDLAGLTFTCEDTIDLSSVRNVLIVNGCIKAVGETLGEDDYLLSAIGSTMNEQSDGGNINIGYESVTWDGNKICNCVYIENTRRFRSISSSFVGYTHYGFKTSTSNDGTKNGELHLAWCYATQTGFGEKWSGYQIEDSTDKVSNGRGIGFSMGTADFIMHGCVSHSNMICAEFNDYYHAQVSSCHFYTGQRTTDNAGFDVVSVTDNGSGFVRVTVAEDHKIETGDIVQLSDIDSTVNGYYKATYVSDTVVDFEDITYTSDFSSGNLIPRNYVLAVGNNATGDTVGTMFNNMYLDAQVALLYGSFEHEFTGGLENGDSVSGVIHLVPTSDNEDFSGLRISNFRLSQDVQIIDGKGSVDTFAGVFSSNVLSGDLLPAKVIYDAGSNFQPIISKTSARVIIREADNAKESVCVDNLVQDHQIDLDGDYGAFSSQTAGPGSSHYSIYTGTSSSEKFGFMCMRSKSSDLSSQPTSGNWLGQFGAVGSDGTEMYYSSFAGMRIRANGDWSESLSGSRIDFWMSDAAQDSSIAWTMVDNRLAPFTDDTHDIGSSSARPSNIYATNGTINTSDAREKTDLVELTDDEVNAAVAISKAMGYTWQWLENGDRTHTGPTVQLIMGIMEDNNLEPFDYSFICYDEWDEQTEQVEVTPAVLDDDGNVVTEATYEDQVILEAGDRYSFRENELIKFCNAGLSSRLDSQQETIDSILSRLDSLEG